jgi:3-oxoacid CoA-transferase subunit B
MPLTRDDITRRAARELEDGFVVNLGIGMPTLVANHIPTASTSGCSRRTGCSAWGRFPDRRRVDADLINAGKQTVTALSGASLLRLADSFAMIRGGHIDMTILGAMEVSQEGDIANWMIPGKMVKGMGGAMDLVAGVKKVVVTMDHCNKKGESKIKTQCTLPLTGERCIDMVITDLCVLEMDETMHRFRLTELAPGVTVEDVVSKTEAEILTDVEPKTIAV